MDIERTKRNTDLIDFFSHLAPDDLRRFALVLESWDERRDELLWAARGAAASVATLTIAASKVDPPADS